MTTIYQLDNFKDGFHYLGKVRTAWLRIYFFVLTLITVEGIHACQIKIPNVGTRCHFLIDYV